MSDTSQGDGWWLASDGKWYAPQLAAPQRSVPRAAERPAPKGIELQPGEHVVIIEHPYFWGVIPRYVFTLGLYAFWRSRAYFILTDQRVISAAGIVNRIVKSIPLARVQDATLHRNLWIAEVRFTSAGGAAGIERLGPFSNPGARQFQQSLLSLAHISGDGTGSLGSNGFNSTSTSVADQLTKLVALRDSGVLTDNEFIAQKTKLLS